MILRDLPLFYVFLISMGFFTARFFLFSGSSYLFIWILGKERFERYKIQPKDPPTQVVRGEILFSTLSNVIFSLMSVAIVWMAQIGMTRIYWDLEEHSLSYFGFTVVALVFLHDAYFYFTHRAMHHPLIYKRFHAVHHRSVNPTPWAAFSFNVGEAVVQALFVNIVVMLFPIHPGAIAAWGFFMMTMNVLGHLGYEFFPKWTPLAIVNTSLHHNMHHKYFHCNYGLYYNWWDRLFGTNHKHYEETFAAIKARGTSSPAPKPEDAAQVAEAANG